MKVNLWFNLNNEDDNSRYKDVLQATSAKLALWDIAQEIFRKARKYGYDDTELNSMVENNPETLKVIAKLEKMFYEILENRNVEIE